MQFGRFHGVAVLALGAVLLLVQGVVIFQNRSAFGAKAGTEQQRAESERQQHGPFGELTFLPGTIGLALVGAGWYMLVKSRREVPPARAFEDLSRRREAPVSTAPSGKTSR